MPIIKPLAYSKNDDGCIVCTSHYTRADGRTQVSAANKRVYLYRLLWEKQNGEIPAGQEIMHICDNPSCVNLDHLRTGSHAENIRDAHIKGRLVPEKAENKKIRNLYKAGGLTQKQLGDIFDLSQPRISVIVNKP